MTRTFLLLAASALALTACDRGVHKWSRHKWGEHPQMTAVSKLDCPEEQGDLKRTSAEPDGKSCVYAADGTEVTLKVVALNGGDAEAALKPVEAELKTLIPQSANSAVKDAGTTDDVNINLPGVSINANDNGAKVNVGPVHIDADDSKANGTVSVNSDHHGEKTVVNANGGDAEIRTQSDRGGTRLTYILTSDKASPGAYKLVGYEARGSLSGPLVVAVVKAKDKKDRDVFDDMKALLKHNVGG